MSIENPTLAHFRHFSSLFTNLPSTFVENSLQINSFYAKQSQFPKSQVNVSIFSKMVYENKSDWTLGENKPNQSQFSNRKTDDRRQSTLWSATYSRCWTSLAELAELATCVHEHRTAFSAREQLSWRQKNCCPTQKFELVQFQRLM
jgi:hypothetical protein